MGVIYPRPVILSYCGDKQNQGDCIAQRIVHTLSNPKSVCRHTRNLCLWLTSQSPSSVSTHNRPPAIDSFCKLG